MMRRALLLGLLLAAPLAGAQSWPDGDYNPFGHEPISVWVDATNLTGTDAGYVAQVHFAEQYWEHGGNGALRWTPQFRDAANDSDADVVLWFRDASRVGPVCGDEESALGCATPFARPVLIELVVRSPDGTYRSYEALREVAEHELGHALGLPHSSARGDIMQPFASVSANSSWRPGDWGRLLGGAAVALVIVALLAWLAWRGLRARPAEVRALRPGEACPRAPMHDFAPMLVNVNGRDEWLDVCTACRGARRPPS